MKKAVAVLFAGIAIVGTLSVMQEKEAHIIVPIPTMMVEASPIIVPIPVSGVIL